MLLLLLDEEGVEVVNEELDAATLETPAAVRKAVDEEEDEVLHIEGMLDVTLATTTSALFEVPGNESAISVTTLPAEEYTN